MGVKYKYRKAIKVEIAQRSKDSPMGRFGGGWNWELGVQVGEGDFILNLLVLSIRITVWRE